MDTVDIATRSKMMSAIRGKDTCPEMVVRRFLHGRGYRYRIHRKDLPGKPDIVVPRLKVCIFVHGCFWHRHPGCSFATTPKTRPEFWNEKFEKNVARDLANIDALEAAGWNVLIVWECQLKKNPETLNRLEQELRLLSSGKASRGNAAAPSAGTYFGNIFRQH
ncbi:very short patch repair endonuclease [Pseudomonas sp. PICF6]|uniref:very short patch repair endonuclease n=1 Tax=Pseudomonas sp. PICF6 TaxID=2664172 RepID=UPI00136BB6B2|nr:DNA mismatch endonuclease Vsr [Pseudomonas sp. PICF6]MXR32153.1 DNA mismatch endonuclease Vsr [Pseudomonas sp. PICF6]